ncbi:preprotein translocase subunit YajC [Paenibacillus sp. DS2015]|uniref:SAVED domain-containing protein n=1 Tax=Paenibacillus sp. DS2015 TaxID=3373917 RepID=UPI003D23A69C
MQLSNMTIFFTMLVILLIGIIFFIFRHWRRNQKEEIFSDVLFAAGIELVLTSFGTLDAEIIAIFKNKDVETNYVQLIIGFILLACSWFLFRHIKAKMYILNINGYFPDRRIEYRHEDVGLHHFQFKEREIDFIRLFKKGINETVYTEIKEELIEKTNNFKSETRDKKRGYTGIAPSPLIMLAGNTFGREGIDEFFEYNKFTSKYYQLHEKAKLKSNTHLIIPDITSFIKNQQSETFAEIVVSISLTSQIVEGQLTQFTCPHYMIQVRKPQDNIIETKKQLHNYVKQTLVTLESLTRKIPTLKKIHLVYSGQSCFSFELGRLIDITRHAEITHYQFSQQSTPLYPWGIVINGDRSGEFLINESEGVNINRA